MESEINSVHEVELLPKGSLVHEVELLETLKRIEQRLGVIETHIGVVQTDCSKMSSHIEFMENVYTLLREPFYYFNLPSVKKPT